MCTFVPCPQFFCLLKLIAHVCTPKTAEDELSAHSASFHVLSLPALCLFIWHLGAGGRIWNMESQKFGPFVQNSGFTITATLFVVSLAWHPCLGAMQMKQETQGPGHKEDPVVTSEHLPLLQGLLRKISELRLPSPSSL
jgi:hypothetical protein